MLGGIAKSTVYCQAVLRAVGTAVVPASAAPRELSAEVRVQEDGGFVPYRDYSIGFDMRPTSIVANGDGQYRLVAIITSKATDEERDAAYNFDLSCLSSLQGCRALCEIMPSVWNEAIRRSRNNEISLPKDELENPRCAKALQ